MLTKLQIKNYALIEHLVLTPDVALNIVTGETGAGKSIMLGAIGLLLGNRADTRTLFNPNEKCIIEGEFDVSGYIIKNIFEEEELDYDEHCVIRREISPQGKTRAFVNDTPVNLETLRRVATQLMDVHSQHDNLLLGANDYQLEIVDTFAQNHELLDTYKKDYQAFYKAQRVYDQLKIEAKESKKEFDYNAFLLDELQKIKLKAGELEVLEQELNKLENAEDVKSKLLLSAEYLNATEQSIIPLLTSTLANLNSISAFGEQYLQLKQRLQSCLIELKDIAVEVENEAEEVELDNEKIATIQQRLDIIYNLLQKHQVKTDVELLIIQKELEQKVNKVLNIDEALETAKGEVEKTEKQVLKSAEALSASRLSALPIIEKQIADLLKDLGMPNASLKIENEIIKPSPMGINVINLLFSANKGVKPQPIKNVASGGEFSRLMLAIKYILANKRALPTIIFDEIDTGISGEVSIKVGNMMREMSRNHQLIAITHLHQIAAQGSAHYFVYKDNSSDRTVSRIRKLTSEERVMEIAQMIGGENPSRAIVENAREILGKHLVS
ncbi:MULTISPECIES: DNA repair protein RecN [unclassified Arcicella]|uniref:DNA repair protein RecN n=1 Tax=unclassified Arcicella TaxID=2644986 RepID=UPI00285C4598|nr:MULTISPECIES: DNA repair protein RecN [unclassified Arcicella]MDR6561202.1 DNA repair protein RecN (Recombination protein N) [Arcicella sp. BE51]MDR6811086.1 DNA repair protein RecN (Recombination protein N) [Arcicella sp. BE140]MDR6822436.1 DNA repair protein RecN (Recombination protein N) [Arcicella sp. BE139]